MLSSVLLRIRSRASPPENRSTRVLIWYSPVILFLLSYSAVLYQDYLLSEVVTRTILESDQRTREAMTDLRKLQEACTLLSSQGTPTARRGTR